MVVVSFEIPDDIVLMVRRYGSGNSFSSLVRRCIRSWIRSGYPLTSDANGSSLVVRSVRLDEHELEALDTVAERLGISRSMAIRSALCWCIESGNGDNKTTWSIRYVYLKL